MLAVDTIMLKKKKVEKGKGNWECKVVQGKGESCNFKWGGQSSLSSNVSLSRLDIGKGVSNADT